LVSTFSFFIPLLNISEARTFKNGIRGAVAIPPFIPPYARVHIWRFRDLSPQGPEVQYAGRRGRLRRSQVLFGLHPILPWQAPPKLIGWRMAVHENRALLFTITVRAFIRTGRHYYALCCLLPGGQNTLQCLQSRSRNTRQVSRGKFGHLPCIAAESTLCALDEYGLCDHRPGCTALTPYVRFLSIGSYFCSTLPSDHASRRRLCASPTIHRHQVG
jgi:hypothetical protein